MSFDNSFGTKIAPYKREVKEDGKANDVGGRKNKRR
jgi:hypothetical protein